MSGGGGSRGSDDCPPMGSDEIRGVQPDRIRCGFSRVRRIPLGGRGRRAVPPLVMSVAPSMAPGAAAKSGVLSQPQRAWCSCPVGESLEKRWRPGSLGAQVPIEGRWEIRLCGSIGVALGGRGLEEGIPGRQGRLLFAYLVRNRDRVCSRTELIDVLWPERPPAAAD